MSEDKITTCISDLRVLIDDWAKVETREIEEHAERLIIAKATELVKIAEPQKKSEMVCNCCCDYEENLQKENAELKKQLEELRFEVGANLEVINCVVNDTHEFLSEQNNHEVEKENSEYTLAF